MTDKTTDDTENVDAALYRLKRGIAETMMRFLDHHPDIDPAWFMQMMLETIGNAVVSNAERHLWIGETAIIIEAAANAGRIKPHRIVGPSREWDCLLPRYIAARLMRDRGHSLSAIGAALGGRDHSTISNALLAIDRRIEKRESEAVTMLDTATNAAIKAGISLAPLAIVRTAKKAAVLKIPHWADKARDARRRGATLKSLAMIHGTTQDTVRSVLGEESHQ